MSLPTPDDKMAAYARLLIPNLTIETGISTDEYFGATLSQKDLVAGAPGYQHGLRLTVHGQITCLFRNLPPDHFTDRELFGIHLQGRGWYRQRIQSPQYVLLRMQGSVARILKDKGLSDIEKGQELLAKSRFALEPDINSLDSYQSDQLIGHLGALEALVTQAGLKPHLPICCTYGHDGSYATVSTAPIAVRHLMSHFTPRGSRCSIDWKKSAFRFRRGCIMLAPPRVDRSNLTGHQRMKVMREAGANILSFYQQAGSRPDIAPAVDVALAQLGIDNSGALAA